MIDSAVSRNRQQVIDTVFALGSVVETLHATNLNSEEVKLAGRSVETAMYLVPDSAARESLGTLFNRLDSFGDVLRAIETDRHPGPGTGHLKLAATNMHAACKDILATAVFSNLRRVHSMGVDAVDAFAPEAVH